jgi:hypothetical protein
MKTEKLLKFIFNKGKEADRLEARISTLVDKIEELEAKLGNPDALTRKMAKDLSNAMFYPKGLMEQLSEEVKE